ncbi:AAA family ATPase [Ectothiorhodospira marina]|uniref:Aminoglycoside phosphotransferase domain-containing protein n=1 Tax=Ectothiorhodospira marina TaxID=1396821 RepID=A0A1H7F4D6_9GAMM|nr:bifunctional aminoglycoside phosphotransferase/ATP-binding protein [Ectothiorhodospira marina]SEK20949.1 hypothetical protein SAMN05444515_101112 [Ectothiorhodospira marina]
MTDQRTLQQRLIHTLEQPQVYPHPVEKVEHIETHISTVLLAGDFAYKIKKPLDLGFLNFTQLERRRFYCEEELRLNRRLAPQIYDDLVAFSGSPEDPIFNGPDTPFEYAVRMKRFDTSLMLDRLQSEGHLPIERMEDLARRVATFHERIAVAPPESDYGEPDKVLHPMQQNVDQIRQRLGDTDRLAQLDRVEAWTLAQFEALRPLLLERKQRGFIRECHGDMHLGNMALVDDEPMLFDGIEFNPFMRWIDIISEVAFLTMDLKDRGASAHANRFLNIWLEHTGDYRGLRLLDFYQVYRAMVRAKVAVIRLGQDALAEDERDELTQECHTYLDLAEHFTQSRGKALFINHGFSGSGKTTLSQPLMEAIEAIRVRSDVERKRMAGIRPTERRSNGTHQGLYSPDLTERTYGRLGELATEVLEAGYPVIVDATFLKTAQRARFADLARTRGLPFRVLDYRADPEQLRAHIAERTQAGDDASDADMSVVNHQLDSHEPLLPAEPVITIDTSAPLPLQQVQAALGSTAHDPGSSGDPGG